MQLAELILPGRVACAVKVSSKKRALEYVSGLLTYGQPDLRQHDVFNCLISREKLGSTGLGCGVAIPHGRLRGDTTAITGAFMQLAAPVDFDAIDNQSVDLVFALLVPEESNEEHLRVLAQLANMFRNQGLCEALRECSDSEQLLSCITEWKPSIPAV